MTVRIGIIGTGAIGRDHARRIKQVLAGGRIVALTDVNRSLARAVRADIAPDAAIYATGEELIAAGDVDAVLVTSWGATHEQYVLASIAAGKPCFCEKPLATTAEGAKRIVEAETAFGRRLVQVGFMRRYDAGYVALKEAIARHTGAPILVHAAHRNPSVPEAYVTPMAIHDTLIHEIDVLRWLLDDDYVSARVHYPRNAARAHAKLRDPQVVVLETRKGVLIDVEIFVNCHYGYDIQCEIVGEDGIARLPEPMAIEMRLGAKLQNAILTDWKDRFVVAYDVELQDFLKAAAGGTAAGPSSWDGYVAAITSDACVAAQESAGAAVAITMPDKPSLYS
ncbi:Gfo/Idh/MocA family oxidoreductase [Bradyrhizobium jicamae]|uniref:Inositol 2-dehydrogenase n=1 Tax=Bradyrhizobium jicamae TaxID=280332 RepID=A0ABS5FRP4_9BRAD|nr:Gfo/Idh/MocA family oxidoreductase [Bradyrhizobium jicamae]MBR0799490.1 Gfo/Idh/MocA family oxidoreductase [Bradyrhizobium jicamae]